jgi:hypothetical protein
MPGDYPERGPEERAYRAQRRERLHQIREHLREMEEHLRHEEEESERWHGQWDDPADSG